MRKIKSIIGIIALAFISIQLHAQVSITSLDSAYLQNFDALSSSTTMKWKDDSTISNWYAHGSSNTITSVPIDDGNNSSGSFYNYGSTGSTDRALGSMNDFTTGNISYGVRVKNNTGDTIKGFKIKYTGEQWRVTNRTSQNLTFSYKISSGPITSLTGSGWINVSALYFTNPVRSRRARALDGNAAQNRRLKAFLINNISVPNGSEIMFRWVDKKQAGPNDAFAIDDVSIAAEGTVTYFSKSSGNLESSTTWGTKTNGSGAHPANFAKNNQIFNIRNGSSHTIGSNWTVSGENSGIVIDNAGTPVSFTIPSNHTFNGTIDVLDNATLYVTNTTTPAIGNVTDLGTVIYDAAGDQTIQPAEYGSLIIEGSGLKSLGGNTDVSVALTLSNNLYLNDYDLTMETGSTISGASSSSFIITNQSGSLIQQVDGNDSTIIFPVGSLSAAYSPVGISLTSNSVTDNFSVNLSSSIYTGYDLTNGPTGSLITSHVVSKTYFIEEEKPGGSDATITLQWTASDEATSFNRRSCAISHYTGGVWVTGSYDSATTIGSNYSRSISGITSFSPFGLSDNGAALPVELVEFNATLTDENSARLNWETASEINNDHFEIERSEDGASFKTVGAVVGHGTTQQANTYELTDRFGPVSGSPVLYYRLKQVDQNGAFVHSSTRKVVLMDKSEGLKAWYNHDIEKLQAIITVNNERLGSFKVIDVQGRLIANENMQLVKGSNALNLDMQGLNRGIYTLIYATEAEVKYAKIIKY